MITSILLTGKNSRVAENILEQLETERDYDAHKCPSNGDVLIHRISMDRPQIIIICLGNENLETAKDYDVIMDCEGYDKMSILIVAYKEDFNMFRENTKLKQLFFLPRPVSPDNLFAKLTEIIRLMESENSKAASLPVEMPAEHREFFEELAPRSDRKHILIVDDDPEQLAMIKDHLSEYFSVTPVRSGMQALKYLDDHKNDTDLILLDYIMPGMDGPAVLRYIRESGEFPYIPVIFLTGMTEKMKVVRTITELKPQGYIVKPAKKSALVAKIIEVLG